NRVAARVVRDVCSSCTPAGGAATGGSRRAPAARLHAHGVEEAVAEGAVEHRIEGRVAAAAGFAEQGTDQSAGQLAEHGVAGVGGDREGDDVGHQVAEAAEEAHGGLLVLPGCRGGETSRAGGAAAVCDRPRSRSKLGRAPSGADPVASAVEV